MRKGRKLRVSATRTRYIFYRLRFRLEVLPVYFTMLITLSREFAVSPTRQQNIYSGNGIYPIYFRGAILVGKGGVGLDKNKRK